jgi:hypothetical protein
MALPDGHQALIAGLCHLKTRLRPGFFFPMR